MIYIQPLLYLEPEPSSPFSKFSTLSSSLRFAKIVNRVDEPSPLSPSPVIFQTERKKKAGGGKKWNNNSVYTFRMRDTHCSSL